MGYGADGKPQTVRYLELTSMLLNELQKQHQAMGEMERNNQEMEQTIRLLKEQIAQQAEENQRVEARFAALEALLSGKTPSLEASAR